MLNLSRPDHPVTALEVTDQHHPCRLAPRIHLQDDRLRFPTFPVFQNDREGRVPKDSGLPFVKQLPRPGRMARHQRLPVRV
jgi:hypothetical protein